MVNRHSSSTKSAFSAVAAFVREALRSGSCAIRGCILTKPKLLPSVALGLENAPEEKMNVEDPLEMVRMAEVMSLLREEFGAIERRPG